MLQYLVHRAIAFLLVIWWSHEIQFTVAKGPHTPCISCTASRHKQRSSWSL